MAAALAAEVEARKQLEAADESLLLALSAESSTRIDERIKDDVVATAASSVSFTLMSSRRTARMAEAVEHRVAACSVAAAEHEVIFETPPMNMFMTYPYSSTDCSTK
jgi:hypothetical protein